MNNATDPGTHCMENAHCSTRWARGCLLDDEDAKTLFATDVYGGGRARRHVVVRPQTRKSKVAEAVRIATAAGWAVTQRGGGMSYTGGYLPTQTNTVMLDLSALNRIISINEEDSGDLRRGGGHLAANLGSTHATAVCACPFLAPFPAVAPQSVAGCPTARCLWVLPVTAAPPILSLVWR